MSKSLTTKDFITKSFISKDFFTKSFGRRDVYYDFKIISSDLTPMPLMDGLSALSYDYLNTGTKGIVTICGWPGVSIKSIFYSTDNAKTVIQLTDFPGTARHAFTTLECSDGTLLVIGGDKNDVPYGSNEMWRYTKNVISGLEGTWTQLTANMGLVWANRIMNQCWLEEDGYIYASFGQLDNSGTPFYNIIRIPELTLTGEDWEEVLDCTAFFAANNITALSDCSVSFDGSNAIITGGLLYTGAFVTNVYNDKVIKINNHGTSISVVGTLNSGGYPSGNYYAGKHWVQFGAVINEAHTSAQNTKGLWYSDNLGLTWIKNYNAPGGRHAGSLFNHFDTDDNIIKMFSVAGNLWNSSYSIQEKDFSGVKPIDIIFNNYWGFLADEDKLSDISMFSYNTLIQGFINNDLWPKIKALYMLPGANSINKRKYAIKPKRILTDKDAEDYDTPLLVIDNGVTIVTNINPEYITAKSNGSYFNGTGLNLGISLDSLELTVDNNALFVFTFSAGTEGIDAGFSTGNIGQYITAYDADYGGFAGALFCNLLTGNVSPASTVGLRGIQKFDNTTSVEFIYNDTIILKTSSSVDTSTTDQLEFLCRAKSGTRSLREQTMWMRSERLTSSEVVILNTLLQEFFANMNMTIPY